MSRCVRAWSYAYGRPINTTVETSYTPGELTERLNALLVIEAKRLLRDRTPANIKRAIELLNTVRETYA